MNFLKPMLESPQIHRLGWTLLHSLWEGAAVGLVLLVCLLVLRKAAASARYLASCVAMLAMPVLAVLTFALPRPAPALPTGAGPAREAVLPTESPAANQAGHRPPRMIVVTSAVIHSTAEATAPQPPATSGVPVPPLSSKLLDGLHALPPWLVLAWLCGVAALSIWNLGGWIAIQRLKLLSTGAADPRIRAMAGRLARRLKLRRAVRILNSAKALSPMVIGAFKPVILLPASVLCELSAAQLESILAHELAHVRRHDYLANLFQSVIETLMFYHPAIWWIGRRIRAERENCCDDIVLSLTRDRVTYVRALALVAARAPGLAPAATGGTLIGRVRRILGLPDRDIAGAPRWLSGALVLALMVTFAVILHPQVPAASATPAKQRVPMQVTILDQDSGRPIGGVNLGVTSHDKVPKVTTDANGRGELSLPPGVRVMNLWAHKDGYVPTVAAWNNSTGNDPIPPRFTMKMERGQTIGGTVADERGNPISGATVFVNVERPGRAWQRVHTQVYDDKFVTDAQGKWQCGIIPKTATKISLRLEHPDFASDPIYRRTGNPSLAELKRMTDVLVLKKGLTVKGRILDMDGKPIAGALVVLGPNGYGWHPPKTHSGQNGGFVLQHCSTDAQAVLVVMAQGHSLAIQHFDLNGGLNGMVVRLKPAKPLIVRIVNPAGQPLADSRLFIQRWHGGTLIWWDTHADAHGRVVWNEAPRDMVDYCISHAGYIQLISAPLVATGTEQTVTLLPEVKVSGRVLDDSTGKPIGKFQVVKGFASYGGRRLWVPGDSRPPIIGKDGNFQLTEDTERDGYAIRIEADGYLPAESRTFHKEDANVALTFRLKPAADVKQTLVMPDGRPLAGAQVLVDSASSQIIVENGLVRDPGTFTLRTQSDSAGHFRIPPQAGTFRLMVLHEKGFAEFASGELAGPNPLVVPPWARIEGLALDGGKPATGHIVTALPLRANLRFPGRVMISSQATVRPDGRYRIDHVMPGTVNVYFIVPLARSQTMSSIGYAQGTRAQARAGEMAHVNIGGRGRPVVGRVTTPPSLASQIDWVFSTCRIATRLHVPGHVLPANWNKMGAQAQAAWEQQWRQSPEVVRYDSELKNARDYPIKLQPDGSFRVEDVQPGTYDLTIQARATPAKLIAAGTQEFTIPPIPGGRSDQPVDLGMIGLSAVNAPRMGGIAPALDVPGVNGKRLRLADFRGKYVLVDFWATWCGPCVAETPFLKSVWSAYGHNPRFAMISLSLDENPEAPRQFAANQKLPWRQGFLGPLPKTQIPNHWGVEGIPSIFLIGPDGRILARNLRGSAIRAAVAQKLGE